MQVLDYEPYGEQTLNLDYNTQGSPYSFTGKELDPSSGLYYYEARWYDPATGHFISTDPFPRRNPATMIPDPARWNEYAYARGNPVAYTDPTGEGAWATALKWGFGVSMLDGPAPGPADIVGGLLTIVVGVAITVADIITDDSPPTVEDNNIYTTPATTEEGVNATTIPDAGENGATVTDVGNATSTEEVGGNVMTSENSKPQGTTIKGYTDHGRDQAMGRDGGLGVTDEAMNDAVQNPIEVEQQEEGKTRYAGQNATVVLNANGEVVTTWANSSEGVRNKK